MVSDWMCLLICSNSRLDVLAGATYWQIDSQQVQYMVRDMNWNDTCSVEGC